MNGETPILCYNSFNSFYQTNGRQLIMEIKKVSIIGLGALGILFGNQMRGNMPKEDLRIIADDQRISRYVHDSVYCNGDRCDFHYVTPDAVCEPADLLIFAVKSGGLNAAIAAVKNHVGPNTVILSLLNGISSEAVIGQAYGMDKILYCVAQGMDAVKVGNQLTYHNAGMISFGGGVPGVISDKAKAVAEFFSKVGIRHEIPADMQKRMWGKFMMNVGVNQTAAVYGCDYGQVQQEGPARDIMILAMREVLVISEKEGVNLTAEDMAYWLNILSTLSPEGKPSMLQMWKGNAAAKRSFSPGRYYPLGKSMEFLRRSIKISMTKYF